MHIEWTWWVLLAIPVAWFLQLVVHEASHLLVGWVDERLKPVGFYPYPHVHEGKFYFARYTAVPTTDYDSGRTGKPRHIAPFYAGLVVLLISVVLFLFLNPQARLWAMPTAMCGLGDAIWFWRGYLWGSPRCDGKRWRQGDPR